MNIWLLAIAYIFSPTSACEEIFTYRYFPLYRHHGHFFESRFPRQPYISCFPPRPGNYGRFVTSKTISCSKVSPELLLNYTYKSAHYPQNLKISESTIPVVVANSSIVTFKGINKLILRNLSIEDVEDGAFDNLHRLSALDLSSNKLTEISDEVLKISSLRELDLSNNKISSIQETDFSKLPDLNHLRLNGNGMKLVRGDIFHGLNDLKKIDVSSNPLVLFETDLRNLNKVTLSDTPLETINFEYFSNVDILVLKNNHLRNLQNFGLLHSDEVYLTNNSITHLDNIPQNVENLDLSHNRISKIGRSKNHANSRIKKFILNHNEISKIGPHVFWNLKNLQELFIASNNLEVLVENSFVNCSNLRVVDLSANKIRTIQSNAFNNVTELVTLNLSNNKLNNFNYNILSPENNIRYLYINGNKINFLDLELFENSFSPLKSIAMNNNSWLCEDLMIVVHNFKLRGVTITDNVNDSQEKNINGISCKFGKEA